MFNEREIPSAVMVVNHKSGGKTIHNVPYVDRLTAILEQKIGPVPTYTFEQALENPDILKNNVISVGGDGTHTTLLKMASERNPNGWIMTIDGGTMGGIPKSLGLGRGMHENADMYANRVITLLRHDALGKRDFTPGIVTWGGSKEPFVMMSGVGYPWSLALAINERQRPHKNKIQRLSHVITTFFTVLKNAPNYELHINERDPILVKNALLVKAPVKKVSWFSLPFAGDVLLYFPHTTNTLKVLGDCALIALHQKPRFGGIHTLPLDGIDRVEARETAPSQVKHGVWVDVDSELRRRNLPAVFQSNNTEGNCGFQLIYRKGK